MMESYEDSKLLQDMCYNNSTINELNVCQNHIYENYKKNNTPPFS